MNKEEKYNKDVLVLEIVEKDGSVPSYQRTLYEASLLGIDRVKFICVWTDEENSKRERGEEIFSKIVKTCEILKIEPLNSVGGYYGELYGQPMIGKIDENECLKSASNLVEFESYKNNKINMLSKRENVGKVLAKHISNLI